MGAWPVAGPALGGGSLGLFGGRTASAPWASALGVDDALDVQLAGS
jgi:hypothetical protein